MTLPRRLSDLVSGLAGREASLAYRPPPPAVQRAVERGVSLEHGRAIVHAAQIRGLEYVGHAALHATASVSQLETFHVCQQPHKAARFQAIGDIVSMGMASIAQDMVRG